MSPFLTQSPEVIVDWLIRTSWQVAALVGLVLVAQVAFRRWLTPAWRHALWMLIVLRLLMPIVPASAFSLFNLADKLMSPATHHTDANATPGRTLLFISHGAPDAPLPAPPPAALFDRYGVSDNSASLKSAVPIILAGIWFTGVVVLIGFSIVINTRFRRRLDGRDDAPPDKTLLALLDDAKSAIGVRRHVDVIMTEAVHAPAVYGVRQPCILFPPKLLYTLSAYELRAILLHELAHIRRFDPLTNALVIAARTIHWFNPIVWIVAIWARHAREQACDALVLSLHNHPTRRQYGEALLKVARSQQRFGLPHGFTAPMGLLGAHSALHRRINMIATYRKSSRKTWWFSLPLVCLLSACSLTDRPARRARESPAGSPVVVYDIRDVLSNSGFSEAPKLGSRQASPDGGPFKMDHPATAPTIVDRAKPLLQLLEASVERNRWNDDQNVNTYALSEDGLLVVTAPDSVQQQVKSFLDQLRRQRSLKVTVEAYFIQPDVDLMPADLRKQLKRLLPQGFEASPAFLTGVEAGEIVKAVKAAPESTILTAPRITLFSGQRAYVMVATEQAYVSDIDVLQANDGSTAYDPQIGINTSGLLLDVQATASADRESVILHLRPQLRRLLKMQTVTIDPKTKLTSGEGVAVQVPLAESQAMNTTTSIPNGKVAVFSGFGSRAAIKEDDDADADTTQPYRPVYLLLKATIIEPSSAGA